MSKNEQRILGMAALIFALLVTAWSVLILTALPADKNDYLALVFDPEWKLICLIGSLASLTSFIAFFGIYERLRPSSPGPGALGFLLTSLGLFFEFAAKSWDTLVYPALADRPEYRGFISEEILNNDGGVLVLIAALSLLLLSGNAILGGLSIKHKVMPLWTAICMITATVVYLVGSLVSVPLLVAGLGLYALAFIRIGFLQITTLQ